MNEKLTTKQKVLMWVASILIAGASFLLGQAIPQQKAGATSLVNQVVDLIGTHSGTTTSPVSFYAPANASTTYPYAITGDVDTAIISISSFATTGPSRVSMYLLGSNDASCNTASTTYSSVQNNAVMTDIHWFDISNHMEGLAPTAALAGTTTLTWQPTKGQGKDIELTNLAVQCVAVEIQASSTILQAQLRTKQR